MNETFQLKPLSHDAVGAALERAVRYRLLNEPLEAESICRDVLDIEPENQQALATLVLALTDQFPLRLAETFQAARETAARLQGEYERSYYQGIVAERRAKCHHGRGGPDSGAIVYDWLRKAMAHYEEAEKVRPPGNDEALLRWNTCARTIMRFAEIRPAEDAPAPPIELE